jgi:DNA-binding NarL/FixJ family response regulator
VLSAAHATAVELRAAPLQREIEDLARRARISLQASADEEQPVAASTVDRVGLTARELDVLQLMAGGATNREIAARLYISQKTVTVHITRILAKLDARTRVEAAGVAQRLGLLTPSQG